MTTPIFTTIANHQKTEYAVSLNAIDAKDADLLQNNVYGTLEYIAASLEQSFQIVFSFDPKNGKIAFSGELLASTKISCLLICGIGLVGPVMDCYNKSKDWNQLKKCLEDQGNTLGASTVACIAACM